MKNLIPSIRNKKLKGNISLLVILILLASSVISLLSINQIQRLLTYWNTTFNYFRAFYLAKAGTELGLTEVYYREAWFQQNISSWNAIVTENLVGVYSGFNPYFTMNISWNFQYLTNDVRYTNECSGNNKIILEPWDGIMLSLFKDNSEEITKILNPNILSITPMSDKDIKSLDFLWNLGWNFTFWIFTYDNWNMTDINVQTWSNLKNFLSNNLVSGERRYLTIKNSWNGSVEFCIKRTDGKLIPYSNSLITVRGNYGDMEVWLQSVVKKEVPFWAMDVLWWPGS